MILFIATLKKLLLYSSTYISIGHFKCLTFIALNRMIFKNWLYFCSYSMTATILSFSLSIIAPVYYCVIIIYFIVTTEQTLTDIYVLVEKYFTKVVKVLERPCGDFVCISDRMRLQMCRQFIG